MKEVISGALEQAEALQERLLHVADRLGRYEGEQLNEAKTEQQLDRWSRERDLSEAMDAAVKHMAKVIGELRRIEGCFEE